MKRNRRAGVEDRWTKTVRDEHGNTQKVPSAAHGKGLRWRARYVGPDGKERAKHFARKKDAQAWVDGEVTTKIGTHTWVDPSLSREAIHRDGRSLVCHEGIEESQDQSRISQHSRHGGTPEVG